MTRNIPLQHRLGRGEFLLGLVDLVHDLEFLALKVADRLLGRLDFVAEGLVLLVLLHEGLLGLVLGQLGLGGADLGLQHLFLRFQPHQLLLGGLDGGLFGGDLGFHGRDIAGDGL